jgi:hypothetical protein
VNQGTVISIAVLAWWVISIILSAVIKVPRVGYFGYGYSYTPGWLSAILWVISLAILVPSVLGIIDVVGGKMRELPVVGKVIGKFKIIK